MLLLVDLLEHFGKVVLKHPKQLFKLVPKGIGLFSQNLGFLTIFLVRISFVGLFKGQEVRCSQ